MYADLVSSKTIEEVLRYLEEHEVNTLEVYDRATESCILKISRPNTVLEDAVSTVQEKLDALGNMTLNAEKIEAGIKIAVDGLFSTASDEVKEVISSNPYLMSLMKLNMVSTQVIGFVPLEIVKSVLEKCIAELIDLGSYQQQITESNSNE